MSFRSILIVIDGTTESQHALNYYAHFFAKPDDDVTVIVHGNSLGENSLALLLANNYDISSTGCVKDGFRKIVSQWASNHHIDQFRVHLVFAIKEQDPGKYICSYAKEHLLECILIACNDVAIFNKPAKLSKALDYVLKNAEIPVLVIPLLLSRMIPSYLQQKSTVSRDQRASSTS